MPLAWLAYALYSDTVLGTKLMTADPIQKLDRELGDWALILIVLSLTVRPLAEIFKKGELVGYRRMIGLFAFFYVCLHLSSYIVLNLQLDFDEFIKDVTKRNFITIGIIAFTLLTPLAITSTKGMIKRLGGKRWQKLHMLIYAIVLLGVFHFFMMIRADFTRPSIYLGIILVLLGYRYWAKWRKSRPRKAVAT
ncbi:MAG: sulfoxide reductase heme-binding subunit YedZ [Rhodospirillaceae bacterium]|nr:sulfoxide reductase heme-binding subunit YedZ [Rhodospirillaceae bacterium]MBT4588132.1 sulfoxide reductase heme-binding subunit YedZ [Rhodospirillaceae bacterium]MBT4937600.1 sulfoxide reductase heme-binding subunit YedZ [Rhodospirillaceae bacterium]MBT5940617.1 sulfoxide reductase heme-binding subunit YedZ [Rhodospirillaceae bacterium]MBT7266794.1 sulfoxide reductase heme-binding subunit YedZ [Rhodospirillaceae bacterium]